ncbi:hypothetical protein A3B45_00510 [Candidatus Daviesbacteria bacterium RIFCSPLOWO2_01_FULL_39_12]|uniref:Glycosyltransferase RgtA/B/C/D-like domain-containing protein n=1 Tax=Candidatus Daviesbacteria bacterium RIFCSPLOWO2_01_FULL_39_12 TaxID=1797785 RepID=A0A1F5KPY5_9BACT|nr:MAG: hypothetical protein A3B45_00510 [Candidatus Daviesbacteria bacterium RIFCSPLOWO2_01_FULL_39_12]
MRRKTLLTFLLVIILVSFIHFTVFHQIVYYKNYFTTEWAYLIYYRSLQPNPVIRFWDVWEKYIGLHNTANVYYIGILSEFLGRNYLGYLVVTIILKIIATLSIFPIVLIIFKSIPLAFLTTIIFSINSSTAGPLDWISDGRDYLALTMMNISFIAYYYLIKKYSKKLLILASFLFFTTYLMSPPRLFTLLLLIPSIEMFWLLYTQKLSNLKFSLIRLIVILLPIIMISANSPVSACCPIVKGPQWLFQDILGGNLYNLLDPLAPPAWTIFPNYYWKFFGILDNYSLPNFVNYLGFLINGPMLIFWVVTVTLSLILSKKPLQFFMKVFVFISVSDVIVFYLLSQHQPSAKLDIAHLALILPPVLGTVYMLAIAIICFLEWGRSELKEIKAAIFVGPLLSMIFITPMWIFKGHVVNSWTSIQTYFLLPALGATLFMGAILTAFYYKLKNKPLFKYLSIIIIFLIIFNLYKTNKEEIQKHYEGGSGPKINITEVALLYDKLIVKLGEYAKAGDILIYFDENKSDLSYEYFPQVLTANILSNVIHQRRERGTYGCIASFGSKDELIKSIQVRNNIVGFVRSSRCVDEDTISTRMQKVEKPWFYKVENFFVFTVNNNDVTDITAETLYSLGIQSK